MTKKLRLVLLIIIGLVLTALISRNATLVWMTLPLLSYILSGLLSIPGEICLSAHRIVSQQRCKAGSVITMTLVVENHGRDIPSLQFHEHLNPKIHTISEFDEKYGILPARSKAEVQYAFLPPRGKYYWENIKITVSDPFFLFEKTIDLPAEAEVIVLPKELADKPLELNPYHTFSAPGVYLSNQPGSGVNFLGVREYSTGDPLRSIYWRLSARHPKQLFSKEFDREEMAEVGLIVDGSAGMNLKSGQEELFDISVQVAAVIARRIISEGNRLSLLVMGEQVSRVFPGTGKQQLARILNQLAACQPGENVSLNWIKYLPVKLFPSHALIILISPLSESDIPAIKRLRARGYQVHVVSPDSVKFVSRSSCHPMAVRAAALERAALLWRIQKMGVKVLDWPPGNSGPFSIENEDDKSDIDPTMKLNHRRLKLSDQIWFSPAYPILLVCAVAVGALSGSPQEIMIALGTLALVVWEIMSQREFGWKGNHLALFDKHKWVQIRHMVFMVAMSLCVSIGGLLIHLPLPFGIVTLAVLLFLYSFDRFYRLAIS